MRLLLDECVPARLSRALPSHQVTTVFGHGWSGIRNGQLLTLAAHELDAFVTVDKNLLYLQHTLALPLAVVVLDAPSNELSFLLPLVRRLETRLAALVKGSFVIVKMSD